MIYFLWLFNLIKDCYTVKTHSYSKACTHPNSDNIKFFTNVVTFLFAAYSYLKIPVLKKIIWCYPAFTFKRILLYFNKVCILNISLRLFMHAVIPTLQEFATFKSVPRKKEIVYCRVNS